MAVSCSRWPTARSRSPATATTCHGGRGCTIEFLAPRTARRRADRRGAPSARWPAAAACTTSTVRNQDGRTIALFRGKQHAHQAAQACRRCPSSAGDKHDTTHPSSRARADRARQHGRAARPAARAPALVAAPCLRQRAALPRGVRRGGRPSRRPASAGRPGEVPVHRQERPARQLPVRHVRGAARAGRARARVERHDRQADGGRLHAERHRHLGRP